MTLPPLPLLRIDDRLLHGQVLVAWAAALAPQRIVLASDAVAADPVRRAVYAALPEEDYAIVVASVAEAATEWSERRRSLVVCGAPRDAVRLVDLGVPLAEINVGGLHRGEGKRELLPYVWLSRQDAAHLAALVARGVALEARDLPAGRPQRIDAAALARLWEAPGLEGGCPGSS